MTVHTVENDLNFHEPGSSKREFISSSRGAPLRPRTPVSGPASTASISSIVREFHRRRRHYHSKGVPFPQRPTCTGLPVWKGYKNSGGIGKQRRRGRSKS